ncbi:hypothetical protein A0J48_023210 [Sphaerospermopsis aphanizomenoides BCCUSP55]|uniref:hypothetical protein n=1 Tax=Sphaerospermopsis aphanizomenoides TaxID=459663 RepID=UPI001907CEEB|nr:hypothetical protein [Sphaerospermopsis aphanizomenoides]MBK1990396.1 hypothetical protein [Sphaerospermopsis aphanizomenoides BCCUSP55]
MKEVLELIEKKTQTFAQLPFFHFLRDTSIDPRKRLGWASAMAPFAMNFGELNRLYLRKEPTDSKLQELINNHTREDDHHWKWFLQDLEKLGINNSLTFSEALKFLWSEELQKTRKLSQDLFTLCTIHDDPILKIVIIEVIEATGHTAQAVFAPVAKELQSITQKEYRYFGEHHFQVESGHLAGVDDIEELLGNLEITEEQKVKALEIVEQTFQSFTEFINEMFLYAQKQCLEAEYQRNISSLPRYSLV